MSKFALKLIENIRTHDITSYAAQCAYFLVLSLFPFAIMTIMVLTNVGYDFLSHAGISFNTLPPEVEQLLKEYFAYSNKFSSLQFSPFIITLIWMSSNAMSAVIKAFNVVNNLEASENRNYFHKRFVAVLALFIMIMMVVLFIYASTIFLNSFVKVVLRFLILTCALVVLYYILPNVKRRVLNIIPGALIAGVLFIATTYTFGFFMENFTRYSLIYGSLSSIILLLILLFLLAYILILGEEINALICAVMKQKRGESDKL